VIGPKQRSEFRSQGFVHVPNFFDPEAVGVVRADAKRIFIHQMLRHKILETTHPSDEVFEAAMYKFFRADPESLMRCGKQAQHLISLHRLALDRRVVEALGVLGLGFANICTRPVLYFNSRHLAKQEVHWRVFAHQDWRSMQGSLDAVVLWLPLVDIDRDLGALEVVPASHRRGLVTDQVVEGFGQVSADAAPDQDFVSLPCRAGDGLFFSSFLVHRSGNNVTESIRWSCHFRYNNLDEETFISRGYPHPYIYKPASALLTPGFPSPDQVARLY